MSYPDSKLTNLHESEMEKQSGGDDYGFACDTDHAAEDGLYSKCGACVLLVANSAGDRPTALHEG